MNEYERLPGADGTTNPQRIPEAAKAYLAEGLEPVPISERSKQPARDWKWKEQHIRTTADVDEHFTEKGNVAIALGPRSGNLCDIDLDWPEAVPFADILLGECPAFGRASSPRSHRLLVCDDAAGTKSIHLTDAEAHAVGIEAERAKIVELRAAGAYTVFPPSIHQSGERVQWEGERRPFPRLPFLDALRRGALVAFLALILKLYPRKPGSRNDVCLALTGALVSAGTDGPTTDRLVRRLAECAGDEEAHARGNAASATIERMRRNEECVGLPRLCELLGIGSLEGKLRQWLRMDHGAGSRPSILVVPGRQHEIFWEAQEALRSARAGIYQRGAELVRVARLGSPAVAGDERALATVSDDVSRDAQALVLMPVTAHWLLRRMGEAARWQKTDREGDLVLTDPQVKHARLVLEGAGEWVFPVLDAVFPVPTLRRDGSILQAEGYDPASRLLFDGRGRKFPSVPETPTKDDGAAALAAFRPLFECFPFVSEAARSVVLAAVLTALIRPSLSAAPFFAFDSPTAGTGKSLLVETISILATGNTPAAMNLGKTDEETEKRLSTLLRAGDPIIFIDNVERPIEGELLCSMMTQAWVQSRILGKSERFLVRSVATVMATGNNLTLAGDMPRRAVVCRIDSGEERPDKRQFPFDPRDIARARFPEFAVAALTALRAYHVADRPCSLETIGSFAEWDLVRGTLVWLGYADPAETRLSAFDNDPHRETVSELLLTWFRCFGSRILTLADIRKECAQRQEESDEGRLFVLLREASGAQNWNNRTIGRMLARHKDRPVAGLALRNLGETNAGNRWQVVSAGTSPAPARPPNPPPPPPCGVG